MYFILPKLRLSKAALALLLFMASASLGQVKQIKRVDYLLMPNELSFYKLASFKEKGVLLYRLLTATDGNYIEFKKLDSALVEQWKGVLPVNRNQSLFDAKTKDGFLVLLFWNKSSVNLNFEVLLINEAKGSYISYPINNAIPFNPTDFEITGNSLIIGGYLNLRPLVLHYTFSTNITKILPGYYNEPGELTELKTYEGNFDVIVRIKNPDKSKSLRLSRYTLEGNLISTLTLNPEKRKNFIHGKSHPLPNGNIMIAGTFGSNIEYARGIFVAITDSLERSKTTYYPFGSLKNFFSFMRPRKAQRIKERIERRNAKGRETKFNYKMLIHELIPYKNQILLVGESYYPRYSYPSYSSRNFYSPAISLNPYATGNPTYRGDYVFDGFQFTHAFLASISGSSHLLWDNSIEMKDLKTMQLQQTVHVLPTNSTTTLLYLFENTLHTKTINDSLTVTNTTSIPIQPNGEEDEAARKDGEANLLTYWYGNYFVATGVQQVHNKKLGRLASERKLFYITKLKVCPSPGNER
jgi:hypothetical protein